MRNGCQAQEKHVGDSMRGKVVRANLRRASGVYHIIRMCNQGVIWFTECWNVSFHYISCDNLQMSSVFYRFVCDCPPELKFNVDAIDIMIRSHLLNMREFDLHLVQVWNFVTFISIPGPLAFTTTVETEIRFFFSLCAFVVFHFSV